METQEAKEERIFKLIADYLNNEGVHTNLVGTISITIYGALSFENLLHIQLIMDEEAHE